MTDESMNNIITYSTQIIDTKHKDWRKKITHESVNEYSFESSNFIEILDKPQYVRPYFDFDEIETIEDYHNVINWLDSLKDIFGEYSIGGYSNDNNFAEYGFKIIKDAHHVLSFHVVYYECKIKSNWMIELMKYKDKKYIHENINSYCDPNVYKLETRQLMRHPLSNKYFNRNNKNNTTTAGSILNDNKPSDLILTIDGTEREINDEELTRVFAIPSSFFHPIETDIFDDIDIDMLENDNQQLQTTEDKRNKRKQQTTMIH